MGVRFALWFRSLANEIVNTDTTDRQNPPPRHPVRHFVIIADGAAVAVRNGLLLSTAVAFAVLHQLSAAPLIG